VGDRAPFITALKDLQ